MPIQQWNCIYSLTCVPSDSNDIPNKFSCLVCTWVQYLYINFKDTINSIWNLIRNLLRFASGYLVSICNFYPHLSLRTLFPALKLTQLCFINLNIFFFLENWQFNHKLAPLPLHIPSLKDCPHNLTKYESKQNSEIPVFQLFSEFGDIWKYSLS